MRNYLNTMDKILAAIDLKVEEALIEILDKGELEIQEETALKWAARACAAYSMVLECEPADEKQAWRDYAQELAHEALEHAALVQDHGRLVGRIQRAIEVYKHDAE